MLTYGGRLRFGESSVLFIDSEVVEGSDRCAFGPKPCFAALRDRVVPGFEEEAVAQENTDSRTPEHDSDDVPDAGSNFVIDAKTARLRPSGRNLVRFAIL